MMDYLRDYELQVIRMAMVIIKVAMEYLLGDYNLLITKVVMEHLCCYNQGISQMEMESICLYTQRIFWLVMVNLWENIQGIFQVGLIAMVVVVESDGGGSGGDDSGYNYNDGGGRCGSV